MKYYTGIGSRTTPLGIMATMSKIAKEYSKHNWVLRTGGAEGADTAFENGVPEDKKNLCEIYIPWKNFQKNTLGGHPGIVLPDKGLEQEAMRIASEIHPAWDYCSYGAKLLHSRNVFQVLGQDLNTPSSRVIFWAPEEGGFVKGGTATAVNLARKYEIPTHNLYYDNILHMYRVLIKDRLTEEEAERLDYLTNQGMAYAITQEELDELKELQLKREGKV